MPSTWDSGFWDSGPWDEPATAPTLKRMNAKVALNLKGLDPRQKLAKLQTSITQMTGNALVPAPNPTLAVAQTHHDEAEALCDEIDALEQQIAQKRYEREQKVEVAMTDYASLGSYTESRAHGDPVGITSCGFDVAGTPGAVQPMPMVTGVSLTTGDDEGTADVAWDAVKNSKSYEVQTSPDPITPGSWQHECTNTNSKCQLTGKQSGIKQWVRVRAINKLGPGPWSDPACGTIH